MICIDYTVMNSHSGFGCRNRVWKGILGIRDLTKIRCGNQENDKYIDGIRDLTAPQEAGLAKICSWDAGSFACLLRIREIVTTQINFLLVQSRWCLLSNQTIECAWLTVI